MRFMDSSVVHSAVGCSKEAQVSEREALAIVVGGADTPAARSLGLVGLLKWLPVPRREARPRRRRPRQTTAARGPLRPGCTAPAAGDPSVRQGQIGADAADQRLDDAVAEQQSRAHDADTSARRLTWRGRVVSEAQQGVFAGLTTHPRAAGTRCVGRRTPQPSHQGGRPRWRRGDEDGGVIGSSPWLGRTGRFISL